MPVVGGDGDDFEIVTLTHFKVVRVVGGGDLHHAGTEIHFDIRVCHDRDHAVHDRQHHVFAHQMCIALVIGMDRHGGIAEHGFGAGGGEFEIFVGTFNRVTQVIEHRILFFEFHFCVRDRRFAVRTPADDAFATVDQALFIQTDKHFAYRFGTTFIHRETFAFPVARRTDFTQLAGDAVAVGFFPRPSAFQEFFTADPLFSQALFCHCFDDLGFGRDGSMVSTRHPQRLVSLHTAPTNENILQRIIECVTHMQLSRNIGRRHHDGIRLFVRVNRRMETIVFLPIGINAIFHFARFVHLGQLSLVLHFRTPLWL